ncbi:MAG: hypothetical protein R3C11_24795 [Planctomycetaceae bacterium]
MIHWNWVRWGNPLCSEGFWKTLFNKALSASEKDNPDVADMKSWMGDDRGLPREIENLLIMVYAEQTNRAFVRFGGNFIPVG